MKHDLEALAALMRRNSAKWILLEDKADRGPLALKCWRWNHETPRAFASGRFEFRTFKDRYASPARYYLEGRHTHATLALLTPEERD